MHCSRNLYTLCQNAEQKKYHCYNTQNIVLPSTDLYKFY